MNRDFMRFMRNKYKHDKRLKEQFAFSRC